MAPSRARGWWRSYFHDHPSFSVKAAESKDSSGKAKVWCMLCFEARVAREIVIDESMVIAGTREVARSRSAIEDMMWAQGQAEISRGWLVSRTTTLICHLRDCENQPKSTRDRAQAEAATGSGSPFRTRPAMTFSQIPVPWPIMASDSGSRPTTYPPFHYESSLSTGLYSQPRNLLSATGSGSTPSTRAPSPALSDMTYSSRQSKRARRSDSSLSQHASFPAYEPGWSTGEQAMFETSIARLTASAGLPLRWVENPEWLALCERFMPNAKSPSRKVLTQRLIPATLKAFKLAAQKQCQGLEATVSYDGWTGGNHHHYIAFMVNCRGRNHVVRVHDASGERKTADNLFHELENVIHDLEQHWNIIIVAIASDAGGEALKARKLARRKHPHLVVPDCFGHQTNLVVGDFFKSNAEFLDYTDKATELIGWLQGKTYVLALLRDVQQTNSLQVLAVIRAVLTRWTAHYLAYRRLLEIRLSLQILVENDEKLELRNQQLLIGDASTRGRSRKNISLIKNSAFWHALARIKNFLEPLAIASNITQADSARVDVVLITFAFLYIRYSKLCEIEDIKARDAILKSIERRWLKTDQDVFIAGILLNPFHKARPFRAAPFSTIAGLYNLLHRLWKRFYYEDPPAELYGEYKAYTNGSGDFQAMHNFMRGMQLSAEKEGTKLNPLEVWEAISHPNHPPTPLTQLARRILSICPNSASVERLWSVFGTILTRLRTRLGNNALLNLAELKLYLREEHLQAKTVKTRLKRSFSAALGEDSVAASELSSPIIISSPSTDIVIDDDVTDAKPAPVPEVSIVQDTSIPCGDAIADSARQLGMRSVVQELIEAVEIEDDEPLPELSSEALSICIKDLFDFTELYWVEAYDKLAMRGLQDELELYELLDLDAEGDTIENEADDALNE